MDLTLPERLLRIMISTTSRFIGEHTSEIYSVDHAWPNRRDGHRRLAEGPYSRSAYVLSVLMPELQKEPGLLIPDYDHIGDFFCSVIAVLYGKRFDSHGSIETNGSFQIPRMEIYSKECNHLLPQNNHRPRPDLNVALDLRVLNRIFPIFNTQTQATDGFSTLRASAKFYLQALQTVEEDPEVAYLHLITAGEILSNSHTPMSNAFIDEDITIILDKVRTTLPDGIAAAKTLESKMFKVKGRFRHSLGDLVDSEFYLGSSHLPDTYRISANNFDKTIASAYDLRSRYVHTGLSFGAWIAPNGSLLEEINPSKPGIQDKEIAKIIQNAPTYAGLERIIRFCLVRYAERNGLFKPAA